MSQEIRTVLLVLASEGAREYDAASEVIARACELTERCGATLHALGILDDPASWSSPLISRRANEEIEFDALEIERGHLDRLAAAVEQRWGVGMQTEAVADSYRADAILRQVQASGADLIIKESGDQRYILGVLSNTDWELLRASSVPVWLASGSRSPAAGICAAIECQLGDSGDEDRLELDYRVFEFAKNMSDRYGAPLCLVHAFDLPTTEIFEGYYPMLGTEVPTPSVVNRLDENLRHERDSIARQHGDAIRTFVDSLGIPLDDLRIVRGNTAAVIKQEAERAGSGLIVMGASRGKGRWDRLLGRVTAEPSLDHAPCDVVFVH